MKSVKILLFFFPFLLLEDTAASKGSMTEAAFILQNKEDKVKKHIQMLKKDLTEACLVDKGKQRTVQWHHCQFRKKVITRSIQELEFFLRLLQQYKERVSQDEPMKEEALKSMVDIAFSLKEKIDLEAPLLGYIFDQDYQERLRALKRKHSRYQGNRKIRNNGQDQQAVTRKRLALVNRKLSHFEEVPHLFHLERVGGFRCLR